jgi:apolipoprotein N-acyltransferase
MWFTIICMYLAYLKWQKNEDISFTKIIFAIDFFLITLSLYSLLLYGLYEFFRYSLDGSIIASSPIDKLVFYGYDLIIGVAMLSFIIIPTNIIYFGIDYFKRKV